MVMVDEERVSWRQVKGFIAGASHAEVGDILAACQARYAELQLEKAKSFKKGDDVFFFKGKRNPVVIAGKFVGTKGKFALVKVLPPGFENMHPSAQAVIDSTPWNWKVSPSLLQHHTPGK